MKRIKKNVSHRISDGRTIQTRDDYLEGGENYSKPGYENKGLYRLGIVIGSNSNNELAIVKGTSKGKHSVPSLNKGKTKYKPVVITKDNEGKPLKVGQKVKLNKKSKSASKKDTRNIQKRCFNSKKTSKETKEANKRKMRDLKKRK